MAGVNCPCLFRLPFPDLFSLLFVLLPALLYFLEKGASRMGGTHAVGRGAAQASW